MNARVKHAELGVAFLILFIFYLLPTPDGLTYDGKMMIGVLFFAAFLFITEALPIGVSGLLVMVIPPVLGVFDAREVFGFFGNEAIFLLIGAFILAAGFQKSGLHRRVAVRFLRHFGTSPRLYVLGVLLLGSLLSLIMSEHGVVVLLLPIVAYTLTHMGGGENLRKAGMIALAYGCSIGSVGTLLGCARNPYTIAFLHETAGISVSFSEWAVMALPVVFAMIPVVWLSLTTVLPPERVRVETPREDFGPLDSMEMRAAVIIATTVLMLLFTRDLGVAVVVLIGAVAMFVAGVLEWKDAERAIPWGVVLLYGGAITIGKGMYLTGASVWLATRLLAITGENPQVVLLFLIIITMLLTEAMSNTAAVAVMLPVGAGLAQVVTGLNVLVTSVAIALAGGFAFMLVIGTPGNLITYSTGYFTQKDLIRSGIVANLWGMTVIFIVANTLWKALGVW